MLLRFAQEMQVFWSEGDDSLTLLLLQTNIILAQRVNLADLKHRRKDTCMLLTGREISLLGY